MKIYTKTGDAGETGLFAGPRVSKDDPRVEAYGTVDELNAALGIARAAGPPRDIDELLCRVQHELFALGAELATPDPEAGGMDFVTDEHVAALETAIDQFELTLPRLTEFILPGGTTLAASLHLARAICRRAERRVVTLRKAPSEKIADRLVIYLNRLGDLLFVLARVANRAADRPDVIWAKPVARPRGS